jgi:hypothetical protein
MPKFDLAKTQELADLLVVERDQRDSNWITRFYETIPDASMATTPDQILQGPDGFSYFVLNMPPPRREFEPFCISHILDFCLENSLGVVIEPQPEPPEWVIPYGLLWSQKELGNFDLNFQPGAEQEFSEDHEFEIPPHLVGKQAVLVGQPSPAFFPEYARKAVRGFLVEQGAPNPGVLLLSNPAQKPSQTLAFSVFAEDFSGRDQFRNFMQHLSWFFPPHYRLSSVSKDSELAKSFQPL